MSSIIAANPSVDTTSGWFTFQNSAQETGYLLLGFSYKYQLYANVVSNLTVNGPPDSGQGTYAFSATLNLSGAVPDDVELLLGGLHFARYKVNGSLSGTFSDKGGYVFSYGKVLKSPVVIPAGVDMKLVSKLNSFWTNFNLATSSPVQAVVALQPGTAMLMVS